MSDQFTVKGKVNVPKKDEDSLTHFSVESMGQLPAESTRGKNLGSVYDADSLTHFSVQGDVIKGLPGSSGNSLKGGSEEGAGFLVKSKKKV